MAFARPISLSIKAQLMLAIVFATLVASVVAAGFSIWREVDAYADTKRSEARALAGFFATAAAEAMARRDAEQAYDVLRAMRHMPQVLYARLADGDGETVAEHGFAGQLVASGGAADRTEPGLSALAAGHPLAVVEAVVRAGVPVGSVELLVSTHDLKARLAGLATNALAVVALALALGFLAAQGFRRGIARRIASVAAAMRTVEETHRFDALLPAGRRDEFGPLVDSFNAMMREIGARDRTLAEHRANLETTVRERTSDLAEAKQAADDANAAKSQFLATMSHEIRTPLNGLMVMAELLAAADLEDRERRYADVIVRSGGTLLAIINDVLDFSKIEAGRIDLEHIPLDLAAVADDVCQLFASKAAGQGLDLAAYVDPSLGPCLGDPVRLGQILGNLVNNAIKFTAEGHVFVEVTPDPARPTHVLFGVHDTGIGIAEEKLASVFDSFSQADQSITRRYGGTGLGLSISQRLVGVMGGEIGVDSRLGEGSRFWFSVPLASDGAEPALAIPPFRVEGLSGATGKALGRYGGGASGDIVVIDPLAAPDGIADPGGAARTIVLSRIGDGAADRWIAAGRAAAALPWPVRRAELASVLADAAAGRAGQRAARGAAAADAAWPRARVLVVDDSAVNREVASEALRRFGIRAETAADGAEARDRASAGGYDLILMDGSMPVMDGFEASAAIRAAEAEAGLARQPIVALTAHAMGEAARWREAGMDGLLLKPFSLAQLRACLAEHLDPALQGPAEAPSPEAADAPSPSGADDPLDAATMGMLDLLAAGDADAVRRIVDIFIESAGPALQRMREAPGADDLAPAAHAFKSMALSVGAKELAASLQTIEATARAGGDAAPDFPAIETLLERACTALRARPWMQDAPGTEAPLEAAA